MPQSGDRAREQGSRLGYTGQPEARRPKPQKAALVTPPLQLVTDGILFESHSRTRREVTESRNGVLQFYHCQVELCSRNTPRCTLLIRRLVKKKKKTTNLYGALGFGAEGQLTNFRTVSVIAPVQIYCMFFWCFVTAPRVLMCFPTARR